LRSWSWFCACSIPLNLHSSIDSRALLRTLSRWSKSPHNLSHLLSSSLPPSRPHPPLLGELFGPVRNETNHIGVGWCLI
jgi:hypothetical protein